MRANAGLATTNVRSILESGIDLLAWTDSGLYRSTNDWTAWNYTGQQPRSSYPLFASGQVVLAGVPDSGIWRSTDFGGSWRHVGLNCAVVDHFAIIDSTIFLATHNSMYHGQIWRSSDMGTTWQVAVDSVFAEYLFNPLSCLASEGTTLYAAGSNTYSFAASTDKGDSWKRRAQVQQGVQLGTVECLIAQHYTMYAGTDSYGIFSSTDSGMHWRLLDSALYNFRLNNKYTLALAIAGSNILAGTNDTGMFLSSDNGASWIPSNTGIASLEIYAFVELGSYVFAGTGSGVYRSSDHGLSWTWASTGLNGALIGMFEVCGKYLFGASDSGMFLSSDSGETWHNVIGNLPDSSIPGLLLSGNNLYAGTQGDGVWRCPLSDFGISSVSAPEPVKAEAVAAYPNPATQSTTLHFTAAEGGYATITVVNALGAEIARLYSGALSAGEHSFTWDAARMAAPRGMYECVVRMSGHAQEVPIILE